MLITRENLERLKKLSVEFRQDCEACNTYQRGLKERYGKQEAEIEREGKKIKLAENILWQEMLMGARTGVNTGAKEVLQEKYPKFFEMLNNNQLLADQLRQTEESIFDAAFSMMSADRLIEIIEGIVDLKLKESKVNDIIEKAK